MLFQYETDRLILKILKPECALQVLDFYNRDKELFEKYETNRLPDFYTVAHQQRLLRFEYNAAVKQTTIRFYVFLKEDISKIIGTVCLHDICKPYYSSAEIGYKFSSESHHNGYATEAIKCCLDMAFYDLDLNRITAMVCKGNDPSVRLLERMGFTMEGICREYLCLNGQMKDHFQYSILRSDTLHV